MIALRALGSSLLASLVLALAACSAERRDWHSAQAADTIESYGRFLAEHPEGELAADARARIEQLAEDRDWKRAVDVDTGNSYERFLAQHPDGKWASEARIRVENFVLSETMPAMTNPAGPASVQPPRMTPPADPARPFSVQLGAFSSEERAREAWQGLVARFPAQLHGLTGDVAAAETGAGRLYRLHAAVPDERTARQLCSALAREKQACVVVLPRNS